jgi:hypothetical protein
MSASEMADDAEPSLDLPAPPDISPGVPGEWTLIAHNKSVLKGWDSLCRKYA